jgi:hypothetical protein
MRRARKILGGLFVGLMMAASPPCAPAATDERPSDYPFKECIETTFAQIRDLSVKVGRFARRTGIEIGKQSRKLAETFRDGGKEIWSTATRDDDQ